MNTPTYLVITENLRQASPVIQKLHSPVNRVHYVRDITTVRGFDGPHVHIILAAGYAHRKDWLELRQRVQELCDGGALCFFLAEPELLY